MIGLLSERMRETAYGEYITNAVDFAFCPQQCTLHDVSCLCVQNATMTNDSSELTSRQKE